MKNFTLFIAFLLVSFSMSAQLIITNDTVFRTADQMLFANELFLSGEPFAEDLGYDLDELDPMVLNSPDSMAYTMGIEAYEYSRYLLGTVISRSGIGLHMIWAPIVGQMAAMKPTEFDGSFTNGMKNGYKEDDVMMMMIKHFGMLANQMAPMHPFPQFADFESGNPQLPQTVAPDFMMDFSSLRWDRMQMDKTLNLAAMGQTMWKQYFWAKDMLGAFHDSIDNGIEADGIISPDSVGSPMFDPNNNVFYGGNNLDGFIGQVLTAESINKTAFLLNKLAFDGTTLGMVDAANYNPANGIKYFTHRIAVTETMVDSTMPPKPTGLSVVDASSHLFDQVSFLLGTLDFKNMMDPTNNDADHLAYHSVFDGDPFPAPMSVSGMMGPYDMMAGASMVLFQNIMAMHFNSEAGTFVDVSNYDGSTVTMNSEISAINLGYTLLALSKVATEFAGMPLEQMAEDALNAQANFVLTQLKSGDGGYYNSFTIGVGADSNPKKATAQAAVARGLYAAYQVTNNADYLNGGNDAYNFLIDNFYVSGLNIFKTEMGNNTAIYTPKNMAIITGGLREAWKVGNMDNAAAIYTRFFKKVFNSMILAEAEPSGETGNDSDGDGVQYVGGGSVATVFAAEAEYTINVTSARTDLKESVSMRVYPNPIQGIATIELNGSSDENIRLSVYDIAGREIQIISETAIPLKTNTVEWDTNGLQDGLYFVRLVGNQGLNAIQKVIVNK
ncbi:MAG: T9SS type A sorting domain-containing protein [Draconibacterium sp.]|nr:T9SS type A sorting domain-containing protein [Draconibacterium sp.]